MGRIKDQAIKTAEELRALADMLESAYADSGASQPDSGANNNTPKQAEQQSAGNDRGNAQDVPESMAPTFDEVKQAVMQAAKIDRDATVAALSDFGVGKATELAEGQYDDAVKRMTEIANS